MIVTKHPKGRLLRHMIKQMCFYRVNINYLMDIYQLQTPQISYEQPF